MTFAQGAFQIDPNATPEQIARKRAQIAAMLPRFGSAKYVGEGLGQLAAGVLAGRQGRKLDAAENAGRASADSIMSGILGGSGGGGPLSILGMSPSGTWTPEAPAPKPHETNRGMPDVASGGLSFGLPQADAGVAQGGNDFGAAGMTPQEMLIAGAQKYGLNPIDVATAISYETGGKFDPLIKGPTTQWGSHEGLIQFGDPQGAKYGAEFGQGADAAWRSQLNPDSGAVWSYLNDTGVKPGMGLPEIYSAINAGGVGRMGASDANNGGAPGTVADKVAGMGDHRANAAQFLGGTWSPTEGNVTVSTQGQPAAPSQVPLNELYAALQNPWLSPEQKALVTSMIGEQQQASDPLRQLQLQKAQFEVDALQNPTVDPMAAIELQQAQLNLDQDRNPQVAVPQSLTDRKALAAEAGLQPGTPEYQAYIATGNLTTPGGGSEFGLNPILGRDKDGNAVVMQLGKDGTAVVTQLPPGVTADLGLKAFETAQGAALGKGAGEATIGAQVALPGVQGLADQVSAQVNALKSDPYLDKMLGPVDSRMPNVTEDAARVQGMIDQLQGGAFLQSRQLLKGGGAITDFEGKKAEAAFVRMNAAQSPEDFKDALDEFNYFVQQGVAKLAKQAGASAAPSASPMPGAPPVPGKRLKFNAATGELE